MVCHTAQLCFYFALFQNCAVSASFNRLTWNYDHQHRASDVEEGLSVKYPPWLLANRVSLQLSTTASHAWVALPCGSRFHINSSTFSSLFTISWNDGLFCGFWHIAVWAVFGDIGSLASLDSVSHAVTEPIATERKVTCPDFPQNNSKATQYGKGRQCLSTVSQTLFTCRRQ